MKHTNKSLESIFPKLTNTGIKVSPDLIADLNLYKIDPFTQEQQLRNHYEQRNKTQIKFLIMHYTECDTLETLKLFTLDQYTIHLLSQENYQAINDSNSNLNNGTEIHIINDGNNQKFNIIFRQIIIKNTKEKIKKLWIEKNTEPLSTILNNLTLNGINLNFNGTIITKENTQTKELYKFIGDLVIYNMGLAGRQTSSHFIITEQDQNLNLKGGEIIQITDPNNLAWHTGPSQWKEEVNLNNTSIGIENVNCGFKGEDYLNPECWTYKFDPKQIYSLGILSKALINSYQIKPKNVLGHADIAPTRKQDPGPLFPWGQLYYEFRIGAWLTNQELTDKQYIINNYNPSKDLPNTIDPAFFYSQLSNYGYLIDLKNLDNPTNKATLIAFRAHFSCNQQPEQLSNPEITKEDLYWAWGLNAKYQF